MADIRPFRALRYSATAGDLGTLIAPPYDVISPDRQHALYERNPHNIVRIEYGGTAPGDTDASNRYTRAAADFAAWRAGGILAEDAAPAFYVYRQSFEHGGRRRFARVEAHAAPIVLDRPATRGIVLATPDGSVEVLEAGGWPLTLDEATATWLTERSEAMRQSDRPVTAAMTGSR